MSADETPAEPGDAAPDPFDGPGWERTSRQTSQPREALEARKDADEPVRVRRERRRRSRYTRRRRRRRFLIAGGAAAVAVVAAVAWLLYTGLRARHELEIVRAEVRQLRSQIASGDLPGARSTAEQLRHHAGSAHDLTTGPVWAGAAAVPWAGAPLDSARAVTAGVDELASGALPSLVSASEALDPNALRAADGSVNLAPIAGVAPPLARAAASLGDVLHRIDGAPSSTWLGSVDSARSDLLGQLTGLGNTVDSANVAAHVLPSMLGADGPKSYIVSFQNEAELRGTGGLPGAFAILDVDHGRFHFARFESDTVLVNKASGLDFGLNYDRLWAGAHATDDYRDSNVSPNFPYAAQVWAAQWRSVSGQQLDGAITLDPTALSYLLKVTGPATMPDGSKVSSNKVVSLTQNAVYLKYGKAGNDQRKAYLLALARAVSNQLLNSHPNTTALVRAAAHGASERRLLVWSRDPAIERLLAPTKIGGAVVDNSAPYVGVALNNAAANKLDYYLNATMDVRRTGCGDSRDVTVTMTYQNNTPATVTDYMYGFGGRPGFPARNGDNLTLVSYYATVGAQMESITLDGKPSTAASGLEQGHPVFSVKLFVPRGATRTLVLHLREPASSGTPTLRIPPMVRPMKVTESTQSCG